MAYQTELNFSGGFQRLVSLLPGLRLWVFCQFLIFWPPTPAQQAQAAIILHALRRLDGAVLFAIRVRRQDRALSAGIWI